MPSLDTNVLLRLLVEDDPAQLAAARRLVGGCAARGEALHVPASVVLELEWVLRSRYGYDKPTVVDTLSGLLDANELDIEAEGAFDVALTLYRSHPVEFADCVHVALAHHAGRSPLLTFDTRAAKLPGAAPVR